MFLYCYDKLVIYLLTYTFLNISTTLAYILYDENLGVRSLYMHQKLINIAKLHLLHTSDVQYQDFVSIEYRYNILIFQPLLNIIQYH